MDRRICDNDNSRPTKPIISTKRNLVILSSVDSTDAQTLTNRHCSHNFIHQYQVKPSTLFKPTLGSVIAITSVVDKH